MNNAMISLEERRKRFGKRWRRKNLVRKLLKKTQVMLLVIIVIWMRLVSMITIKMLTMFSNLYIIVWCQYIAAESILANHVKM